MLLHTAHTSCTQYTALAFRSSASALHCASRQQHSANRWNKRMHSIQYLLQCLRLTLCSQNAAHSKQAEQTHALHLISAPVPPPYTVLPDSSTQQTGGTNACTAFNICSSASTSRRASRQQHSANRWNKRMYCTQYLLQCLRLTLCSQNAAHSEQMEHMHDARTHCALTFRSNASTSRCASSNILRAGPMAIACI